MASKTQIRERWFNRGADAVERVWPGKPRCYVCPLCMRGFLPKALDGDELSLEHAPPKSLGGRSVALTCRECNNRAGRKLDREMLFREEMLSFAMGTMSQPLGSQLKLMSGQTVNVKVQHTGSSMLVLGSPRHNDPRVQRAWKDELDQLVDEGVGDERKFEISLHRGYRHRNALIGWLRAAYLVAFAALGYRYILNPALKLVRQQLADENTLLLKCFSLTAPGASPKERQVLIVEEPASLDSVLVQMGRHLVFLPTPTAGGLNLYDRLAQEQAQNRRFEENIRGKLWPWPTEAARSPISRQAWQHRVRVGCPTT